MWAVKQDLVTRYGQEYIDKITTRNKFDDVNNMYYADQTEVSRDEVLNAALSDAKAKLLFHLSCCYNITEIGLLIDSGEEFSLIKNYHIKLTISMLKAQGDCKDCDACLNEFKDLCDCGQIISDNGVKPKVASKISVTEYESCIPYGNCCHCGKVSCCCGK